MRLDASHNTAVTDEQFKRLTVIHTSAEAGRSWQKLLSLIGTQVQCASELEHEIAGLVQALMVPDDPLEHAGFVQPLSAYKRSEFLRELLRDPGGPHWKTLINEVQAEAVFRNNIAHGVWETFEILPDGSIEEGWFLGNRKKRKKDGSWYIKRTRITEDDFTAHWQRVRFLRTTIAAVRFNIIARYFASGEHEIPTVLGRLVETYAFETDWREPWYQAITRELFPPAA